MWPKKKVWDILGICVKENKKLDICAMIYKKEPPRPHQNPVGKMEGGREKDQKKEEISCEIKMAKREMSTTLKNLKFMQRATLKVEPPPPPPPPPKEEEEEQVELKVGVHLNFASPNNIQNKKCLVVMEGNPHPEVLRGRISFQNFNPSIDKLNEAVANSDQSTTPVTSSDDGKTHSRENGSLSNSRNVSRVNGDDDDDDGGHERKQTRSVSEIQKSPRNRGGEAGQQSPANNSRSSQKKQKREKLDWNLLRPPKAQKRPA